MDDELTALMEKFQKVQQASTKGILNDRNCVEIVQKLLKKKLIEIIYTTDGREYITLPQLEKEIRDEIEIRSGRITAVELPSILNVSQMDVDNALKRIIESHQYDGMYQLTPTGEVITASYISGILEEISLLLKGSGRLSILSLSKRFNLENSLLNNKIKAEMLLKKSALSRATLEDNYLYTGAFVHRQYRYV